MVVRSTDWVLGSNGELGSKVTGRAVSPKSSLARALLKVSRNYSFFFPVVRQYNDISVTLLHHVYVRLNKVPVVLMSYLIPG